MYFQMKKHFKKQPLPQYQSDYQMAREKNHFFGMGF
jgi:hypothetical protein